MDYKLPSVLNITLGESCFFRPGIVIPVFAANGLLSFTPVDFPTVFSGEFRDRAKSSCV